MEFSRERMLTIPLAQRHARLSRKIHTHKLPTQKFRKSRSRDHGSIISRKPARRKENRNPLHRGLAFKRAPQFLIGSHAPTHKKRAYLIFPRRRECLGD